MTILQSAKDKINKRAYARFLKNKKQSLQHSENQDIIRRGDQVYAQDSFGLRESVCSDVLSDVVACPDGFRKFQLKNSARAEKVARAAATVGALAPLVLPAKSQSHFIESIDQETGEIQRLTPNKTKKEFVFAFDADQSLLNRFALQAESRRLLKSETRLNDAGRPVPVYRVCDCLRNSVSGAEGVGVSGSSLSERARFTGLQTCGSVWHCPVCASRISEVRRLQIREMVDMWQKCGKGVIFITNTIRHDYDDDLRLMLSNLLDTVWNRYINNRKYKNLRESLGYIGRVRSVEVTHGSNGWHPHIHEIWLIEKTLSPSELRAVKRVLFEVWNGTLLRAGMSSVTAQRGVTVQNGQNAADYLAKYGKEPTWDIGRELTGSHSKKSYSSSRTPFDLLRDSLLGDSNAGRLFKEYAIAFSGKRQLYFSTGLKDFFQLDDSTDEEIAESANFDTVVFAYIPSDSWRLILLYGCRATVLQLAISGGASAVDLYVQGLKTKRDFLGHKLILSNA